MSVGEIWEKAREVMTVERIFGEPFEKDGTTFIPVAAIRGGGGGGGGEGDSTEPSEYGPPGVGTGFGTGFGVTGRPVGAYVIRDGRVEWKEATDTTRTILGWQVVAVLIAFVLRSMFKQRSKTKRRLS